MSDDQFLVVGFLSFVIVFFVLSKGLEQGLLYIGKLFFSKFGQRVADWRYARALKRKI